ncbi:MAG: hypothetical protein J6I35_04625 [Ruminobacter sp.]|uniref:hypothetical protein n=1 Tax=Ruminobacter sp. TaxID=2774296 RepID=UPI001B594EFA|nr:hypothetical protein [Ruminobacter sp.]MBP3748822.1 hypothetical protein [Ruminobacter sp.]
MHKILTLTLSISLTVSAYADSFIDENRFNSAMNDLNNSVNSNEFSISDNGMNVDDVLSRIDQSKVRNSNYSMPDTSSDYDAECAIWLCLPTKFKASECAKAHKALVKRLAKLKPPLVPLSNCLESSSVSVGDAQISSHDNVAAFIPSHKECVRYEEKTIYGNRGKQVVQECAEYGYTADSYVKDRSCNPNCGSTGCHPIPAGCTKTVHYVEVLVDGQVFGEPYFY